MKKYRDLREHLKALEDENLLQRVTRPINKDTELFPLVRWQFRGGITEQQRRGWLFENVVDSKGKKYPYPFALGVLASSRKNLRHRSGLQGRAGDIGQMASSTEQADRASDGRERSCSRSGT